jgi:hypothetical protein
MLNISPVELNFKRLRIERQMQNNQAVFNAIGSGNIKLIYKHSNEKEIVRVLEETELTIEELIHHCSQDNITTRILAGRFSKKASRQGSNDEDLQISVCANIGKHFNIKIENLPNDAYRPTKMGEILSKTELKQRKVCKSECLKSFDGKISGQIEGWIFAKVVFESGGHQDNVFEEADHLCNWVKTYQRPEFYILLIDTDLIKKYTILKEKYNDITNILITNHLEFQQYILDNYGTSTGEIVSNK